MKFPNCVWTAVFSLSVALFQTATFSVSGTEEETNLTVSAKAAEMLRGVHRIVFLGDSITQDGNYVVDCECWLLEHGFQVEVLNLGLGSETATDLTPEENAWHLKANGFGRPFVSERLDRALAATKPDLLFACYGMNDSTSLTADARGIRRFSEAITNLRDAAIKAGVKRVVICTPPVYDDKGDATKSSQDDKLAVYTTWLLSQRAEGWDVVGLSGKTGGRMSSHCDLCIRAPASETYLIQEFHLPIYHCLCLMLEDEFFGGADSLNDLTGFPFQGRRDETQPSSQPVK